MLIKWTSLFPCDMLHVKDSFNLIRILNREYAILLPFIRSATILKEATTIAISLHDPIKNNKKSNMKIV